MGWVRDILTRSRAAPVLAPPRVPTTFDEWFPPPGWSGQGGFLWTSGESDALGLPVVSAALHLMTSAIAQMPMQAWTSWGQDQPKLRDPQPPIVVDPSPGPNRAMSDWLSEYVRAVVLRGNYLAVLGGPDATGRPTVMTPIPYGRWSVEKWDITGSPLVYLVDGERFDAAGVFHVAMDRDTGDPYGHGLLDTHQQVISAAVAAERWTAAYFTSNGVPSAVIAHPNPDLTQAQAELLKAQWAATQANGRAPVVVPIGTVVTPVQADPVSAQLVESRKWSALALAEALGVPGVLLGLDAPSMTYRNITDVWQQFISTRIMGLLVPLEQQLSLPTITPAGTQVRFNTDALLRADIGQTVQTVAIPAYTAGVIDRDEARRLIGFGAGMPGGGEQLTQSDLAGGDTVVDPAPKLAVVAP